MWGGVLRGCTPGSRPRVTTTSRTPNGSWCGGGANRDWCPPSRPVVGQDIHSGDRAATVPGSLHDPAEDRTAGRGDRLLGRAILEVAPELRGGVVDCAGDGQRRGSAAAGDIQPARPPATTSMSTATVGSAFPSPTIGVAGGGWSRGCRPSSTPTAVEVLGIVYGRDSATVWRLARPGRRPPAARGPHRGGGDEAVRGVQEGDHRASYRTPKSVWVRFIWCSWRT